MILLDTHILVWLALSPEKLSRDAFSAIRHARNARGGVAISGVTLYEIALLATKGRIDLQASLQSFLRDIETRFTVKPIHSSICSEAVKLPDAYPKDPMDRIIGATAIVEGLALVTADAAIRRSKAVRTIW